MTEHENPDSVEARAAKVEGIGSKRKRVEDARFTQGKGNYVDDIKLPGMLFGDFVRSPYGHARVKSIDASKALALPGVKAVLTAQDLAPLNLHWMPTLAGDKQMVLADGKVLFQNQEVAFVVAENRYIAAELDRMTEASRRILPTLGAPRETIRSQADSLQRLSVAVDSLADRVEVLSERVAGGMVVGFVSEQRTLGGELAEAATASRQQARQLAALSNELSELAVGLETKGRELRGALLRSVVRSDRQVFLDDLFLEQLRTQRRLRKSVSDVLQSSSQAALEDLRTSSEAIVPAPRRVGTTSDARRVIEDGTAHRLRIDAVVQADGAGATAWQLAFQNEIVTVLSEQASPSARSTAYGFSAELLDDVTSELGLAWGRAVQGVETLGASFPDARAFVATPAGLALLTRILGILAVAGGWLAMRRHTPRITTILVKTLARTPVLRPRLGLLVRWSGLIQSILPWALGILALWLLVSLVGPETPMGQILWVTLIPVLLYLLGRAVLLGATRRITARRPALVEIRPPTLERLQRTYANLGVVVAVAYALDGVARVAVGSGRVVSLLGGFIAAWVGVWAVGETVRWRASLAESWAELTPDAEPPGIERRVTRWMARSRLGFVLSPFALARIVSKPFVEFFRGLATETSLVRSFRAWLLRRRSDRSSHGAPSVEQPLPQEYLDAFPLYPALDEDGSLIVAREEILDDIMAQWKQWKDTRTDGSLVLIGEKGSGKTTIATQIARRVETGSVVKHTLQGKPTASEELIRQLAEAFGFEPTADAGKLSELIGSGDERVVILDEAHNIFLREVDGYAAYDTLVDLVNTTSTSVFWILVFNSFTWSFLNESRG